MIYNLAISLYALAVRLASLFHKKARLMTQGHKEVYKKLQREIDINAKYIWIHAASLGEFEQGRPLIERIKKQYPQFKILLTFFSPSGYEVRKNYELADTVCYLPFDRKRNVKKFIKLANPAMAIFIKYEFWFNYVNQLYKRNIPVYMVSAIFRPDQLFFKWYGQGSRNILKYYKCICVQDENSQKLLANIGINNVTVCGDTRFDRVNKIKQQAKELPLIESFVSENSENKPKVLVAGSSWPKDEDIFISFFNNSSETKLIIAPHEIHESHLNYIEGLVKRPLIRYSQLENNPTIDAGNFDCLIIDSIGKLSSIYRYGDIAYIGGGFGAGIHNVLEAAVYNIPVIFGPNFKKFREANELIVAGGGYPIQDESSFRGLMEEFLQYPKMLTSAGNFAGEYVKSNSGVVSKVMDILTPEIQSITQ
ncbi:3-deoxy-D-manno-octulosonic acid transferase [Dysgonomonas sp. 216]|uniref:3-deoxy-D-manno-octulosonic acid transferase n=1 Tax=Dysgonomonas sp. 216 TaxID=2302934 RepID=UPI0013D1F519|nr:glycosyltransferase N-terminal domain-containing protein [Dysgonomonas sp. 216]NDW18151.1 3-deoxy-D-manno-octulosonic acid transferase [Dysgonomonas sp. 216]